MTTMVAQRDNAQSPAPVALDDLTRRCQAGDHAAYDDIYRALRPRLYHHAFRMLDDSDEADDVIADTMTKLWRVLPTTTPGTSVSALAYRIATNACLDVLRRRQRLRWQPWDAPSHDHLVTTATDRPEQDAIAAETVAEVRAVLAQMGRRHRAALLMVMHDDMGPADLGPALGIRQQAAKSMAYRAREEFRRVAADLHLTGVA